MQPAAARRATSSKRHSKHSHLDARTSFSQRFWQADFAAAAADAAARAARGELDGHRAAMKRYARDRFLWKHVAEKWEAHFLGRAT